MSRVMRISMYDSVNDIAWLNFFTKVMLGAVVAVNACMLFIYLIIFNLV